MTNYRKKYVFLTLLLIGLTFFFIISSTLIYPRYYRLKARLTHEFELTVKGASVSFHESVNSQFDDFNQNIDDAFDILEKALIAQADELDGYLSRISYSEPQTQTKISDLCKETYQKYIHSIYMDFGESYKKNRAILEQGLLIRIGTLLPEGYFQMPFSDLDLISQNITYILRSKIGLATKLLDDGAEWIPFIGDSWGFLKIVYDPRKEYIEKNIRELTMSLKLSSKRKLIKYRKLELSYIEQCCRDSFNGNYAVLYYLYLTYIRR